MDHDEAMDRNTRVTIEQAHKELGKHCCEGYVMNGELYARNEADTAQEYDRVCLVVGGMIQSKKILEWLGY
jgi:hypothetical protein